MHQHWQVHVQLQCLPTTLDIFHSEVYTYSIGGMMLRCSVVIWVYSFIAFDITGEASVSNLSYMTIQFWSELPLAVLSNTDWSPNKFCWHCDVLYVQTVWITDNQRHFNWNIIHCDIIPAIQLLFLCSFLEIMVTNIIILVVLLVILLIFYNQKFLLIPVWCWIICVVVIKWRVPGYYYFICHTVSLKFEIRYLAIQMS